MLQLTPIEKTVAGQELIAMGRKEGLKEGLKEGRQEGLQEGRQEGRQEGLKQGIKKGELIGEIRLGQRLLKQPVSSPEELAKKSLRTLKTMFRKLDQELNALVQ